jgi:hypothetical protein
MQRPVKPMSLCSWNGTIRPRALIAHIDEKQGERSAGTQVVVEFVIALLNNWQFAVTQCRWSSS